MSNVLTQGIRVSVESFYVPARSQPERRQYIFAYTVRIANEGDTPVQLISRPWIIQDAHGRTEHVRGPGVVGAQPQLEPGQSHEYTSFCPLRTPSGPMRGTYQMVRDDSACVVSFGQLQPLSWIILRASAHLGHMIESPTQNSRSA